MNDIHVKNISILIHFMESLNDPRFTMARFTHDCETPACALGWACSVPALKKEGLDIKKLNPTGLPLFSAVDMIVMVFGGSAMSDLFSASLSHIKTPQDWATHARDYLKSKGHAVVPPTQEQVDDFARFMGRVMEPVALGSFA